MPEAIATIGSTLGASLYKSKEGGLNEQPKNKEDVYVGVEVEIENTPSLYNVAHGIESLNSLISPYTEQGIIFIKGENSLRGKCAEVVTCPFNKSSKQNPLNFFSQFFACTTDIVEFNERTGIHIHGNARPLRKIDIVKVGLLTLLTEAFIYRTTTAARYYSSFAVPIKELGPLGFCKTFMHFIKPSKVLGIPSDSGESSFSWKYLSTNVLPVQKFGTVEFRHFHGTLDMELINKWISVVQSIMFNAPKLDIFPISNFVMDARNIGILNWYRGVVGEDIVNFFKEYYTHKEFKETLEEEFEHVALLLSFIHEKGFV